MEVVQEIKCKSWDEFKSLISEYTENNDYIFRGHADCSPDPPNGWKDQRWKLQSLYERWFERKLALHPPGMLRDGENFSSEDNLQPRLVRFRKCLIPHYPQAANWNPFNLWAFGRHHGLITRLLDWTWCPLTAAFFAFEAFAKVRLPGIEIGDYQCYESYNLEECLFGCVSVWALCLSNLPSFDEFHIHNSTPPEPGATRQRAQRGLFTELSSTKVYDLEAFMRQKVVSDHLVRFILSGTRADIVLNDLKAHNKSYSTLFPDPEGWTRDSNLHNGTWGNTW